MVMSKFKSALAKRMLSALKDLGVESIQWVRDVRFSSEGRDEYLLYMYKEKIEKPKRELKLEGYKGILWCVDGSENRNFEELFKVLEKVLLTEDCVIYPIEEVIKVVS